MPGQLATTRPELTLADPKANARRVFDLLDTTEATREDYKRRIDLFLRFVKDRKFDHNTYLAFKRELAGRNDLTVSTKNKYLATARVFLKELNRQGTLPMDITQNIKGFSQDKKHKRDGLNQAEVNQVADKLRLLGNDPKTFRLKALFCLLALQGLRQVEITRLDVKDLDLIGKRAFVHGKGRDDKEAVDLHPETVKTLKAYLKTNKVKSGALFTSLSNNHARQRLTTRAIRGMVKDLLNTLGIEKTTHGFRHFYATTLVKQFKGNLLEVSQYTRHRSLEMLQVYYDRVKKEADLPKYYQAFSGVTF